MREEIRDLERLNHILEAIENVEKYSVDKSFEDIKENNMIKHAIVWNIMIMGEAANKLTKDFCQNHPNTNWRGVTGMRNVLVHDYYNIDDEEIWNVLQKDIPVLKSQIQEYVKEIIG